MKSEIATRHLQGYSELTLQAPISRVVESLDSRSYATTAEDGDGHAAHAEHGLSRVFR